MSPNRLAMNSPLRPYRAKGGGPVLLTDKCQLTLPSLDGGGPRDVMEVAQGRNQ